MPCRLTSAPQTAAGPFASRLTSHIQRGSVQFRHRMKFNFSRTLITALLIEALVVGCVPLGVTTGKEQVITSRTNSNGRVVEQIVGLPTEHHWMMLIAPDGPELNTVLSETWRFYLIGSDGKRELIRFLQQKGHNAPPWHLIAPIPHTNLWIGVIYAGSLNNVEKGHFDYRVICFTSKRIVSEKTLDYPDYGEFNFDSEKHILTYKIKGNTLSYDPLANIDSH